MLRIFVLLSLFFAALFADLKVVNENELTQMQNDVVSKQIFEKPDYWLWQHKRFKEFHNDIYAKGKN